MKYYIVPAKGSSIVEIIVVDMYILLSIFQLKLNIYYVVSFHVMINSSNFFHTNLAFSFMDRGERGIIRKRVIQRYAVLV